MDKDQFYDCHAHQVGTQYGGFLIALEDDNEEGISNSELRNMSLGKWFVPVEYVSKKFERTESDIVKYHPRYEQYDVDSVIKDIVLRQPKGVIIDTLNEPYWEPNDYWMIAKKFPNISFLFSHAGGYKILDFIKICEFNHNVWLDFSYSQNFFGLIGDKLELKAITDIMKYAFQSHLNDRIMFGSDFPGMNQKDCIDYYIANVKEEIYKENFLHFLNKVLKKEC